MTPEDRSLLISDLLVALKSSDTCLDMEEQQWVKKRHQSAERHGAAAEGHH
tara:strand:- start:798 stop:950 length:153 start_codon:yes stop_codon:yes gene_type:complete